MKKCVFTNDNNCIIYVPYVKKISNTFIKRNNHEVIFRQINTYLIKKKIIKNNIIDLGAWIGDNSIPWAKNIEGIVYSIDPSPRNISFINLLRERNNLSSAIKTIQTAISDKNEIVGTSGDINHCSFVDNGTKHKINAVSLDYLYDNKEIDNIGYIHLDVEGYEWKVINGAKSIIQKFRPILSIEQHLDIDPYKKIADYFSEINYDIFLINEILPGCSETCRNLFIFPKERDICVNEINKNLDKPYLLKLPSSQSKIKNCYNKFKCTVYGTDIIGKEYEVLSICDDYNDNLYLFAIHNDNYTKIIAMNNDKSWVSARYILGEIELEKTNICNAYYSTNYIIIDKEKYNIKNIIEIPIVF